MITLRDQRLIRPNIAHSDHVEYALIRSDASAASRLSTVWTAQDRRTVLLSGVGHCRTFDLQAMKQIKKQYLQADICVL